jgi:hypothetical protein
LVQIINRCAPPRRGTTELPDQSECTAVRSHKPRVASDNNPSIAQRFGAVCFAAERI